MENNLIHNPDPDKNLNAASPGATEIDTSAEGPKRFGVLLFILVFLVFGSSAYAEEKKLKFRGSADTKADLSEVVINIHPEMLALDKFEKLDEK